jgi:hypothetical protein
MAANPTTKGYRQWYLPSFIRVGGQVVRTVPEGFGVKFIAHVDGGSN